MKLRNLLGDRGASAVEFAVIAPVLILLVLGIIEASLMFNAQITLTNAAREGARYSAVHATETVANIQTRTVAAATMALVTSPVTTANVSVTFTDAADAASTATSCPGGGYVTVRVDYQYKFLLTRFVGGATVPLAGKAKMQCGG
ncbi:MAG: TadE/TadG family type IV pilus assembly protein [Agromyces sp.]